MIFFVADEFLEGSARGTERQVDFFCDEGKEVSNHDELDSQSIRYSNFRGKEFSKSSRRKKNLN